MPESATHSDPQAGQVQPHKSWFFLAWALAGAAILFGWHAIGAGFALDDAEVLLQNPIVTGSAPAWRAFSEDFWHPFGDAGLYRPLVLLSFRWQGGLGVGGLSGWHAFNVLLHLWVILLAWKVFVPGRATLWTGLALWFFAWHPVQTESVLWIAGRSSSLCAFAGLSGLLLWQRAPTRLRPYAALVATLLPLLVKEDGVSFAVYLWFLAGCRSRPRDGAPALRTSPVGLRFLRMTPSRVGICVGILTVLCLRANALGSLVGSAGHAVSSGMVWPERVGHGAIAIGQGLGHLVWPWGAPLAPDLATFRAERWRQFLGLGMAGGLALAAFALRKQAATRDSKAPFPWAPLCALLVCLLPWLQVVPAPEWMALRFWYLPLLFAMPLVQGLAAKEAAHPAWRPKSKRNNGFVRVLPFVVLGVCASGVHALAPAYRSVLGHWAYRTQNEPLRAEAWNGLGNEHLRRGDESAAEKAFTKSTQLRADFSRPWVGLALIAERRADWGQAERYLLKALEIRPQNPVAWGNLGRLSGKQDRWNEAVLHFQKAADLQPGRAAFWRGLARAHWKNGQPVEARAALERALTLDPALSHSRELRRALEIP